MCYCALSRQILVIASTIIVFTGMSGCYNYRGAAQIEAAPPTRLTLFRYRTEYLPGHRHAVYKNEQMPSSGLYEINLLVEETDSNYNTHGHYSGDGDGTRISVTVVRSDGEIALNHCSTLGDWLVRLDNPITFATAGCYFKAKAGDVVTITIHIGGESMLRIEPCLLGPMNWWTVGTL